MRRCRVEATLASPTNKTPLLMRLLICCLLRVPQHTLQKKIALLTTNVIPVTWWHKFTHQRDSGIFKLNLQVISAGLQRSHTLKAALLLAAWSWFLPGIYAAKGHILMHFLSGKQFNIGVLAQQNHETTIKAHADTHKAKNCATAPEMQSVRMGWGFPVKAITGIRLIKPQFQLFF